MRAIFCQGWNVLENPKAASKIFLHQKNRVKKPDQGQSLFTLVGLLFLSSSQQSYNVYRVTLSFVSLICTIYLTGPKPY